MSAHRKNALPAAVRWRIAARLLLAAVGGYVLASLFAAVLAVALPLLTPLSRAGAVLLASLSSFAVYAATAIWIISARSARAWGSLAAISLLLGLALLGLSA